MTEKGTVPTPMTRLPAPDGGRSRSNRFRSAWDPFSVLGVQETLGGFLARTFIPGASEVHGADTRWRACRPAGARRECQGLFEGRLDHRNAAATCAMRRPIRPAPGKLTTPIPTGPCWARWTTTCSSLKARICACSTSLGAHPIKHEGARACISRSGRPMPRRVSVVGDFNDWDGRRHVMRLRSDVGVWEIFAPGVKRRCRLQIRDHRCPRRKTAAQGRPFARRAELRPATASIVATNLDHDWGDQAHRAHWGNVDARRQPMSIYEVHPGSWRRHADGTFLSHGTSLPTN
jgi:1,4-alpha-glucan branching enzyme